MEKKTKRVELVMEPTTHKAIKQRARDEGRSLGGHLVHLARLDLREAYLIRQREGKA